MSTAIQIQRVKTSLTLSNLIRWGNLEVEEWQYELMIDGLQAELVEVSEGLGFFTGSDAPVWLIFAQEEENRSTLEALEALEDLPWVQEVHWTMHRV
ncbi:MAG: hypothetical protein CMJ75_22895 [Planctomycetaceae bacterium]|nr:hypothetical protein [Planctomycetaceae bacterium]